MNEENFPVHWKENSFLRHNKPVEDLSFPLPASESSDKRIKVQWMDFWTGFPEGSHFSGMFTDHQQIRVVNDDPDVIIGSVFGNRKQDYMVPVILISWECRKRWLARVPFAYNRWDHLFINDDPRLI